MMRRRGFTFIELMLSLLIMIGSSVIVTQGLSRWTSTSETRGAVADCAALLRRASAESVGLGHPYVIKLTTGKVVTLTGQRWTVGTDKVNAKFVNDRVVPFPKRVLAATLPEGKSTLVIDAGGPPVPTPIKLSFAEGSRTITWTCFLNADGTVTQTRDVK